MKEIKKTHDDTAASKVDIKTQLKTIGSSKMRIYKKAEKIRSLQSHLTRLATINKRTSNIQKNISKELKIILTKNIMKLISLLNHEN